MATHEDIECNNCPETSLEVKPPTQRIYITKPDEKPSTKYKDNDREKTEICDSKSKSKGSSSTHNLPLKMQAFLKRIKSSRPGSVTEDKKHAEKNGTSSKGAAAHKEHTELDVDNQATGTVQRTVRLGEKCQLVHVEKDPVKKRRQRKKKAPAPPDLVCKDDHHDADMKEASFSDYVSCSENKTLPHDILQENKANKFNDRIIKIDVCASSNDNTDTGSSTDIDKSIKEINKGDNDLNTKMPGKSSAPGGDDNSCETESGQQTMKDQFVANKDDTRPAKAVHERISLSDDDNDSSAQIEQ